MTNKELKQQALDLKLQMSRRRVACANGNDIIKLMQCHQAGDYAPMQETKLYNKYSGEYCEYLEILNKQPA